MRSKSAFLACTMSLTSSTLLAKTAFMHEDEAGKRIVVCNDAVTDCKTVTPADKISLYPDLSADGQYLVYVQGENTGSLSVVMQDLTSGAESIISYADGARALHPDLSGNGRYLAFASGQEGARSSLVVVELGENQVEVKRRDIADDNASLFFPALASDGSFLVFQKDSGDGKRVIIKKDLAKGTEVALTDGSALAMAPSLSFDDRYVTYTSKIDGNWDVYRQDLLTGTIDRLTTDPGFDFAPTFDAKGNLLFASNRTGRFELYRLTGKNFGQDAAPEKLTNLSGDVYAPTVSGDESYVQSLTANMLAPARSSFGTAMDNERIYVVGGHQGHEHTYPPESFLANLEYFDLKDKAWHTAPPRPVASHGFEVAAYGGKLYAFGGFAYAAQYKPKWKSLTNIDRFDPVTNEWKTIGHMPRARSSFVLAQVGSKAYFFGGWDSTPKHDNDLDGVFHRVVDVFDFATETMTATDILLPDPLRRAFTGVVKEDKVYLIGGLGQGASHFELLDQVTVFDAATGVWSEETRLPFATFAPAAGFVAGRLHVFGGMYKTAPDDYKYVSHIYKLDGSWSHTGRYLHESKGFSRVVNASDNQALVLGGHEYLLDGTDTPVLTSEWFSVK